jgi:hypothetical protein
VVSVYKLPKLCAFLGAIFVKQNVPLGLLLEETPVKSKLVAMDVRQ